MEKTFVHGGNSGLLGICSILISLVMLAGGIYEAKSARIKTLIKERNILESSILSSNSMQIEGLQNENM